MAKTISVATKVQVLWETGTKKPTNIAKKLKISESTAYRHVAKLLNGLSLERNGRIAKRKKVTPNLRVGSYDQSRLKRHSNL